MNRLFTIMMVLLLFQQFVTAQSKDGALMGKVLNEMSGDEVENAKVSIEIEGAHVKYGVSDDNGNFRIYNIKPGIYDLVITAMGFAPLKITNVPVKELENTDLEIAFHGETFSQDTVVMTFKEVVGNAEKNEEKGTKTPEKKEKKTKEQKKLEKAASKLDD